VFGGYEGRAYYESGNLGATFTLDRWLSLKKRIETHYYDSEE